MIFLGADARYSCSISSRNSSRNLSLEPLVLFAPVTWLDRRAGAIFRVAAGSIADIPFSQVFEATDTDFPR